MARKAKRRAMLTLGLDPSLRAYGWAVYDSEAEGPARRVASGHEGTLASSVPVARFMHFRALVRDLLSRYRVDAVGIESPAYEAGPFQTIHFGLMMFSLEAIFEKRRDCVLYDPATLKYLAKQDSAKRRGTMQKLDMQRYVQLDTMDVRTIDNNEADAYCAAKFAARFMGLKSGALDPHDLTPSESAVFLGRKRAVKTPAGKVVKRTAHVFRENSRFFSFSRVPAGSVDLPKKQMVDAKLLKYLEDLDTVREVLES